MNAYLADALVIAGLAVVTISVYGLARLPDVFVQLHAASKSSFVGIVLLLGAACLTGDGTIIARAGAIAVLLTITTPVSAHVIAQAAFHRGEVLRSPGSVDETGDAVRPEDE